MDEAQAPRVGSRIRDARLKQGLSLREVSRRAQLSAGGLSQVENGRAIPSLGGAERLAAVLGTTVDSLLNNERKEAR